MGAIVVSAADAGYFHLLKGMVLSLKDFASSRDLPVAVLDAGLLDDQRRWLEAAGVLTVAVDLAPLPPRADGRKVISPSQRLRPRLPEVIPGHDVYMYMDADTWLQSDGVVPFYLRAGSGGVMAVVPEVHTAFRGMYRRREYQLKHATYTRLFDNQTAERLASLPTINCGCFAMAATAPHWALWAQTLDRIIARDNFFYSEQIALNHVLYTHIDEAPCLFMPPHFNWVCHQALPVVDPATGRLCDPLPPFQPLGIVHLTSRTKDGPRDLPTTNGRRVRRSLLYRAGEY